MKNIESVFREPEEKRFAEIKGENVYEKVLSIIIDEEGEDFEDLTEEEIEGRVREKIYDYFEELGKKQGISRIEWKNDS
jgi:hypothetical protein